MRIINAPTIERGRRCQNCIHYDNGPTAVQSYKAKRFADMQHKAKEIIERSGVKVGRTNPSFEQESSLLGANYTLGDKYIREGVLGVCKRGMAPGDFVHAFYLCQGWTGSVRPDGAEKPDELPAEARARVMGDDDAD